VSATDPRPDRAGAGAAAADSRDVPDGPSPSGGCLYVVATPIGNLDDITLRAIDTLRAVPLIAAEDTRLTRRLLDRHGITARTTSFHARSGPARLAELIGHLQSGADLALVTDAGTPIVSDPGEALVSRWGAEGGRVIPIPGASAVLAAIAATGVAGPRWSFEGFLPRSGRDRRERLARIAGDERGTVIYEAPNRVHATLEDLSAACGRERSAAVARELTKVHEEIVRGTLGDLAERAATGAITFRGEFVLVVGWSPGAGEPDAVSVTADLERALAEVDRRVARGTARGDAARAVAVETGIARRQLYRVAEDEA
jgi:16S rRNA (cytidine1402-2'-O)-methyltransferase